MTNDPDLPPDPPPPPEPATYSAGAYEYPADGAIPPPVYYPTYGPGYDPHRPAKPPGTNGKAVASILCSAIGLVACCVPVWIVGLVLGIVAMREVRRTGQDGYGLALTGAIIGGLATAGTALTLLAYLALMASGWQWI